MTEEDKNLFSYPKVIGDPVADYWIYQIQQQTNLTIREILEKAEYIQKHGHGKYLVRTNNERVSLSHVAEDYDIKLKEYISKDSSPSPEIDDEKNLLYPIKINPFDDFPAKESPRTRWNSPWYRGYDVDKWREAWEQIIIDALNNGSPTNKGG